MKNKKPVLIIVILKNVFSATRLTKKTSKTAHAAKIAKVSKLIHNSFLNFISAGCPCEEFDCSILDDFAESCKDPSKNENYQRCAKVQEDEFIECVHKCDGPTCSEKCGNEYSLAIQNCPCAKKCPCKFHSYHD